MKRIMMALVFVAVCGVCRAEDGEDSDIDYFQFDTMQIQPANRIMFSTGYSDGRNNEIGRIFWNNGKVEFSGNIDESAEILFKSMFKKYIDLDCIKEKSQED